MLALGLVQDDRYKISPRTVHLIGMTSIAPNFQKFQAFGTTARDSPSGEPLARISLNVAALKAWPLVAPVVTNDAFAKAKRREQLVQLAPKCTTEFNGDHITNIRLETN